MTETEKESKLKKLLILLSRIFTLSAIIIAFAHPVWNNSNQEKISTDDAVIIYIDNSYSMQLQNNGDNLLQASKKQAIELINTFPLTQKIKVLHNDILSMKIPFSDKNSAIDIIEGINFSSASTEFNKILNRISLDVSQESASPYTLIIFSDFQQSTTALSDLSTDSLRTLMLVQLQGNNPGNIFVDSCWLSGITSTDNPQREIQVSIRNSGQRSFEKTPITLKINGKQKTSTLFSIKSQQQVIVPLPFLADDKSIQFGEIILEDHPMTFDNNFFFNFTNKERINVLEIYEKEKNPFLNRLFKNCADVEFQSKHILSQNTSDIEKANVIIFNEVETLSQGLAEKLASLIDHGKTDIVLIPHMENNNANNTLLKLMDIGSFSSIETHENRIGEVAMKHPIFDGVFDEEIDYFKGHNIDLPKVHSYYASNVHLLSNIALRMENDMPLLITRKTSGGNMYAFTTSLRKEYTSLPMHSLFAPTFYRMALLSAKEDKMYHILGDKSPVALPTATNSTNGNWRIKHHQKPLEIIPSILVQNDRQYFISEILQNGHYELYHNDEKMAGLSYNYSPKESLLEIWEIDELMAELKKKGIENITQIPSIKDQESLLSQGIYQKSSPLWYYFLLLALAFIATETIILRTLK